MSPRLCRSRSPTSSAGLPPTPMSRRSSVSKSPCCCASVVGDASVAADVGAAVSDALLGLLVDSAVGEGLGALAGSLISDCVESGLLRATLSPGGRRASDRGDVRHRPGRRRLGRMGGTAGRSGVSAALAETLAAALDTLGTTVFGNAGVQEALGSTVATLLTRAGGRHVRPGRDRRSARKRLRPDGGRAAGRSVLRHRDGRAARIGGHRPARLSGCQRCADGHPRASPRGDTRRGDPAAALSDSVRAPAANPVLQAALDAVLPGYLDSILDNDDIREGVGVIAQQVVTDLLRNKRIRQLSDWPPQPARWPRLPRSRCWPTRPSVVCSPTRLPTSLTARRSAR